MFNEWITIGGLEDLSDARSDYIAKYRAIYGRDPVMGGPVSTGTYDPNRRSLTDLEKKKATEITKRLHPDWNVKWEDCASVDSITGECASFVTGGGDPPECGPLRLTECYWRGYYYPKGYPAPISGAPTTGAPKQSPPYVPTPTPAPTPAPGAESCTYTPAPAGCNYIKGPNFVEATNCGLVLKCADPAPGGGASSPAPGGGSGSGELCPTWGWVTRPIEGTAEYQVFRCSPGQPVTIDPGLQTVGRREALERQDLLSPFMPASSSGGREINWLLLGGIGLGAYLLLGKKKRR